MALAEGRVQFLNECGLFGRQINLLPGIFLFQRQPPVIFGAKAVVRQDLLDRNRRDPLALNSRRVVEAGTSTRRQIIGLIPKRRISTARFPEPWASTISATVKPERQLPHTLRYSPSVGQLPEDKAAREAF
ncbi:hypothetical protein FIV00_03520 [Labrenzia sp. THAF82]|nr:hypothetical protein FIV00_03520 [Labrenzia sp. THAF82]